MKYVLVGLTLCLCACTTLPTSKFQKHNFPKKEAFVGDVKKPYRKLGLVQARVDFPSLTAGFEVEMSGQMAGHSGSSDNYICQNYYNKGVNDLVKKAKAHGGDAVIQVRSVVFLQDGKREVHTTPECADDGEEGQVLLQGIAIKWLDFDGKDGFVPVEEISPDDLGVPPARVQNPSPKPVMNPPPKVEPKPEPRSLQPAILPDDPEARAIAPLPPEPAPAAPAQAAPAPAVPAASAAQNEGVQIKMQDVSNPEDWTKPTPTPVPLRKPGPPMQSHDLLGVIDGSWNKSGSKPIKTRAPRVSPRKVTDQPPSPFQVPGE